MRRCGSVHPNTATATPTIVETNTFQLKTLHQRINPDSGISTSSNRTVVCHYRFHLSFSLLRRRRPNLFTFSFHCVYHHHHSSSSPNSKRHHRAFIPSSLLITYGFLSVVAVDRSPLRYFDFLCFHYNVIYLFVFCIRSFALFLHTITTIGICTGFVCAMCAVFVCADMRF